MAADRHPLWAAVVWTLGVWVAGGIVLAAAALAAPFSEAARAFTTPGRHVPKPRQVVVLSGGPATRPTRAAGS
jgi:hypothetical protein